MPMPPGLATVAEDCYLGVHARFVRAPSGEAGQMWKVQLWFDSWQVGVHVYCIFTHWENDREHITLSRFPARIVSMDPRDAMTSPAIGIAGAYDRPPGKVELILQATPVRLVTLSMYGGARDLGAVYCSKPEVPLPPPPPRPTALAAWGRLPPPQPMQMLRIVDHEHDDEEDNDAAIAGASAFESQIEVVKEKVEVRSASGIVALIVAAIALIIGAVIFVVRCITNVQARFRAYQNARRTAKVLGRGAAKAARKRVKLFFDDAFGVEVATPMDVADVRSIEQLRALAIRISEDAGGRAEEDDEGLTLHYKEPSGKLRPVTARANLDVVLSSAVLRLSRSESGAEGGASANKSKRGKAPGGYAAIARVGNGGNGGAIAAIDDDDDICASICPSKFDDDEDDIEVLSRSSRRKPGRRVAC